MSSSTILRIASSYLNAPQEKRPEDRLTTELQHAGGSGYWKPPHNLMVNFSLSGVNLWMFSILMPFWERLGFDRKNNGIVIKPGWKPLGDRVLGQTDLGGHHHMTDRQVDIVLKAVSDMKSIPETVKEELRKLEQHFHIEIPEASKALLIKNSLATAKRRWTANMLKIKNTLVPLDGSKPRDIGLFD